MGTQEDRKDVDELPCICCHKPVRVSEKIVFEKEEYDPERQMWEDGTFQKLSCGYASRFDGDMYYMGICDNCIEENVKKGILFYAGDYMFTETNLLEHPNDAYSKARKREQKINKLIDEEDN